MLDVNIFDSMRVGLASPEQIRSWSHGEVKKPETINYRTLKPERDGLFCERIFGPTHDWECHCGKYKRVRYKGIICDRCGVEVTRAKVRRERMGHIELAAPVSHIWYFKGIPSRMGLILGITPKNLERILYFAAYIVLEEPKDSEDIKKMTLLSESEYRRAREKYGESFKVGIGAEAVEYLLKNIDLDKLAENLRQEIKSPSAQKRFRAIRRLEVVEAFRKSGNKPEWMILRVLPVIPPDLRPMVQLDGGRFATSDLNDLYRRVINRNNRLKKMLTINIPELILRNEKRMLQEAVDALIDNGRRGRPVTGSGGRALKSLSDMLKGKQGRFRQNLLGKRVDYSGRSVIVVGPQLKLHQCGLPKEMALELFKPFVMKKLSADGNTTIKAAKRKVERASEEVWAVLEEVIKEHPVLLNRAPTLHRLGIQAFEPVLTEGRALKLHPLACTAYNADFDGDQMAIHLPLSAEAQAEARVLMLAANHILAPKDGKPIIVPTQDMVLGTYYLTTLKQNAKGTGRFFTGIQEALMAYNNKELELQSQIFCRMKTPDNQISLVNTSLGRLIFNEILPENLRYFKKVDEQWTLGIVMNKKELGNLVAKCYDECGATKTAEVIDGVKNLGYHYACVAGMTVAISDVIVPPQKKSIIDNTKNHVKNIERQFDIGLITEQERYKKVVSLWNKATEDVADAMMKNLQENQPFNPIYMMADSGARGNKQQMRQLAGMRGLMADPSGKIIDLPITANFREGLSVSDYFISSHGARKGLTDTALRTADSGYLTRRLVDVAQDVIVREEDCDVSIINLKLLRAALAEDTFDAIAILHEELNGRILARDVNEDLKRDTTLNDEILENIGKMGVPEITLRGRSLTAPNSASHSLVSETIKLGTREETARQELKHKFIHAYIGKQLAKTIGKYKSGALLTHEDLEAIIESDAVEMFVRNNNVRGIEVEPITEGSGVIESLADRIVGRVLAEDIYDNGGKLVAKINDDIDKKLAARIAAIRTGLVEVYELPPGDLNFSLEAHSSLTIDAGDLSDAASNGAGDLSDAAFNDAAFNGAGDLSGAEPLNCQNKKTNPAITADTLNCQNKKTNPAITADTLNCHNKKLISTESNTTAAFNDASDLNDSFNCHNKKLISTAGNTPLNDAASNDASFNSAPSLNCRNKKLISTESTAAALNDTGNLNDSFNCRNKKTISTLGTASLNGAAFNDAASNSAGDLSGAEPLNCRNKKTISAIEFSLMKHTELGKEKIKVKESVGRTLAEDVYIGEKLLARAGTVITAGLERKLEQGRSNKVKIRSVLTCKSQFGVCIKCYGSDLANQAPVEVGEAVGIIAAQSIGEPGTQLTMRTFHTGGVAGDDITQGLPRVEELFEARKPKHNAIISEVEGEVIFGRNEKNDLLQITVKPEIGIAREYTIPFGARLSVNAGDWIKAGAKLTEGAINPHDILRVNGLKATHQYLVYEVQKVYKSQGVEINDKHIEVMVRQMLHKVKIEESGDTEFLPGEFIDINAFESANTKIIENGGLPAVAKPILLGITKASLATDSFLSAASFQETTRVLMGDFPLMTETGTFVINGAERVIVSQLVRSPGVYYSQDIDQTGKKIFSAQLIPNRGAWIELETEPGDKIRVRIDRTRKMPVTTFLRALGFETDEQILQIFDYNHFIKDELEREEPDLKNTEKALEEVYKHIRPNEPATSTENAMQLLNSMFFDIKRYDLAAVGRFKIFKKLGLKYRILGKTLAEDLADFSTGEIIFPKNVQITEDLFNKFFGIKSRLLGKTLINGQVINNEILDNILKNERWQIQLKQDLTESDLVFKAGQVINNNVIEKLEEKRDQARFQNQNIKVKIITNKGTVTKICTPQNTLRTISTNDICAAIGYLLDLMEGEGKTDDIDHLANRRVRSVGELLQNQFRIGMARMERVCRDRMTTQDADIITPQVLINIKPVIAAIKEFFGSSQLSQFMDQHNPLSELTHKRRLSALGPGGLSRERAGFEVRDVHNSHYGRMCPIETPEGPNIGLIGSLANYAKIDQFGFIQTPYRKVINHAVSNQVFYIPADDEEPFTIAQANEPIDANFNFINERVTARHNQFTALFLNSAVQFMDVSPKQVVSIATALIPFLENDDANRALMGANMQRQAVPLLKTQAPLVGTGMEAKAAADSGVMILAKNDGVVSYVDANSISISHKDGIEHYTLQKFCRSNQGTCINQIPIVACGEHVTQGQPIADGPATSNGELALGYNIIVAYMPWEGFNYEDAILLSQNLLKRDIYTSIHIEEHQCDARDTKLGPEDVTRDIPNVAEDALANLDDQGIIAIGADVRPGDILVGKVTPETE